MLPVRSFTGGRGKHARGTKEPLYSVNRLITGVLVTGHGACSKAECGFPLFITGVKRRLHRMEGSTNMKKSMVMILISLTALVLFLAASNATQRFYSGPLEPGRFVRMLDAGLEVFRILSGIGVVAGVGAVSCGFLAAAKTIMGLWPHIPR